MKRKILSVLLTVVLVLTLGLVTAVPVAAQDTLNVIPFILESDDGNAATTATWSTEYHAGSSSVELANIDVTVDANYANVWFYLPGDVTLAEIDLETTSFWCKSAFGDRIPYLMFEIPGEFPSSGVLLRINNDSEPSDDFGDWAEFVAAESSSPGWQWEILDVGWNLVDSGWDTWETLEGLHGNLVVDCVVVELSAITVATIPAHIAYVDLVTISGTPYDLEGTVDDYTSIQAAIGDATPGDIVSVAPGIYDEQVVITKSLTLQGAGDTTIIQPSGPGLTTTTGIPWFGGTPTMAAIVSVEATGDEVTIRGLKIDASLITATSTTWVAGLVYLETSGTIEDLTIIGYPAIGCRSVGIWASALTEITLVEVTECTIIDQNRAGIYAYGATITADYHHNTITGPGALATQVPNGFFFLEGAMGSATYNTITELEYLGATYRSSGIGTYRPGADLIFGYNEIYNVQNAFAIAGGSGATIEYNDIHDCHTGVKLEAIGENRASNTNIQYNDIYDNDFAIRCGADMGDGNEAHYNNFVGNLGAEWVWGDTWIGAVCNVHDTYILDAELNWWGSTNGPGQDGANDVSVNVDYSPWLGAPYPEVSEPVYPVYIGTTGYETIQEAVTDASPDDTLIVGPGTYVGDIIVDENLTLSAPDGAKLTGTGGNPVVTIEDYNVTLEGFEIDPGDEGIYIPLISAGTVITIEGEVIHGNLEEGIEVGSVYGTLNIIDCIIADNVEEGIYIEEVDDGGIVVIQGNVIGAWEDADYDLNGNDYGIYIYQIYDGSTVTIGGAGAAANLVIENSNGGIHVEELFYDSTLTIDGNIIGAFAYDSYKFDGNGYGVYIYLVDYGSTVNIRKNAIAENSGEGIYIDWVGYDGDDAAGDPETEAEYYALFQTYGANNVTIEGNTIGAWEYDGHSFGGNEYEGIEVYNMDFASTLTIRNNTIAENYDGMYVAYYGYLGDVFYNDPETYPLYFGPVVLIQGNRITDNEDYGIYCDEYDYGTSVTIEDNLIAENLYGGIYHCCGPYYGSSITVRGNTIVNNSIDGGDGGIYVPEIADDSSYTVKSNLIAGNFGDGVYIGYVEYDSSLIIRGNTIGAGTRDGMSFAGNDGSGILIDYVRYDSTAEISQNTIAENKKGIAILEVDDGSVDIINNNTLDNTQVGMAIGTVYNDGSVDIHGNNIVGNDIMGGVKYLGGDEYVNAIGNWWGDASGPSDQGPGTGDKVSTYVYFSPWLTSPAVWEIKATLDPGWNTFSTPIALDSAIDELAELGLDIAIAYGFRNGDWVLITIDNDKLVPCEAFYVKMNSGHIINLMPNPDRSDPPTTALSQGWNLVGLANLGPMAADEALTSAYLVPGDLTGYDQVTSPEGNMGSWSYLRGGADAPDMLPTEGYWVFMNNAGALAGFTFTPIQLQ